MKTHQENGETSEPNIIVTKPLNPVHIEEEKIAPKHIHEPVRYRAEPKVVEHDKFGFKDPRIRHDAQIHRPIPYKSNQIPAPEEPRFSAPIMLNGRRQYSMTATIQSSKDVFETPYSRPPSVQSQATKKILIMLPAHPAFNSNSTRSCIKTRPMSKIVDRCAAATRMALNELSQKILEQDPLA
jgi:hypothetical protein